MSASDYYQKRENRIARLKELAEKKEKEGSALLDRAHKMAEIIPFGQPILVGHYSEKGDRNYRDRIHNTFDKGFKTLETAEYYKTKAAGAIDNNAISSDAPDALELLKDKLKNLKDSHQAMIAGNKIIKNKKLTTDQKIAELVKLGLTADNLKPDALGDIGFPKYAITNSGANIRNVEKRIEILEKQKSEVTTEINIGNISIINSVEENRIMIMFPGIPSESIRAKLKGDGFRWSPSNGAWQAYRTAAWKIPSIIKMLSVMPVYVNPENYLCVACE